MAIGARQPSQPATGVWGLKGGQQNGPLGLGDVRGVAVAGAFEPDRHHRQLPVLPCSLGLFSAGFQDCYMFFQRSCSLPARAYGAIVWCNKCSGTGSQTHLKNWGPRRQRLVGWVTVPRSLRFKKFQTAPTVPSVLLLTGMTVGGIFFGPKGMHLIL